MYPPERQREITRLLVQQGGRTTVTRISESLDVTAETVRRDLDVLQRRGVLRRVHGGAELLDAVPFELALADRHAQDQREKRAIATHIANELPTEGVVVLDSGSLTYTLAGKIARSSRLKVITNNLPAAQLLTRPGAPEVLTLPGSVRGLTTATVDPWTVQRLQRITADVAVVGVNGLTSDRGLTTTNSEEGAAKRAMLLAARRRIVPVVHARLGRDSLITFADVSETDLIVTDPGADPELVAELRSAGAHVVVADWADD